MFGSKPYPHCLSIHAHMVYMDVCTCTCGIYGCTYMHILTYVYPVPRCLSLTLKHHSFLNSACGHSMTMFSASKLNTQWIWRVSTKAVAFKKPLPSHRQILDTESLSSLCSLGAWLHLAWPSEAWAGWAKYGPAYPCAGGRQGVPVKWETGHRLQAGGHRSKETGEEMAGLRWQAVCLQLVWATEHPPKGYLVNLIDATGCGREAGPLRSLYNAGHIQAVEATTKPS